MPDINWTNDLLFSFTLIIFVYGEKRVNFEDELIIESLKRELFFQDKIRCVAEFNSRDSIIKFVKRHAEKIMKILFPGGRVRCPIRIRKREKIREFSVSRERERNVG